MPNTVPKEPEVLIKALRKENANLRKQVKALKGLLKGLRERLDVYEPKTETKMEKNIIT